MRYSGIENLEINGQGLVAKGGLLWFDHRSRIVRAKRISINCPIYARRNLALGLDTDGICVINGDIKIGTNNEPSGGLWLRDLVKIVASI